MWRPYRTIHPQGQGQGQDTNWLYVHHNDWSNNQLVWHCWIAGITAVAWYSHSYNGETGQGHTYPIKTTLLWQNISHSSKQETGPGLDITHIANTCLWQCKWVQTSLWDPLWFIWSEAQANQCQEPISECYTQAGASNNYGNASHSLSRYGWHSQWKWPNQLSRKCCMSHSIYLPHSTKNLTSHGNLWLGHVVWCPIPCCLDKMRGIQTTSNRQEHKNREICQCWLGLSTRGKRRYPFGNWKPNDSDPWSSCQFIWTAP